MARERLSSTRVAAHVAATVLGAGLGAALVPATTPAIEALLVGAGCAGAVTLLLALSGERRRERAIERLSAALRSLREGGRASVDTLDAAAGAAPDGEVGELAAAVRDLSRHLEGERRRTAAETARLRTVLDGMSEGVALLASGRVVFANPAFSRLLEIGSTVEGLSLLEAVRRYDVAEASAAVGAGGAPRPRDIETRSGRVLQLRAAPLVANAAVIVLLDVTEARSLECMRREFVQNASHELRTPVAAIQAVADTLSAAPSMDPADRARFERILLSHAERLSRLVTDLLDLSRAEAVRPAVAEPVDVAARLACAAAAVRARAEAKRLQLVEAVPQGLPRIAASDTAFEQVLVNLLDNAIKYTPAGGRVTVRASAASGIVHVEVEDTGIGIPPEHLPRVFERFYRVDPSRARDVGGTGLGLAIVKHLAQSYGGDVGVRSRVGEGSVFTVSLPVFAPPTA